MDAGLGRTFNAFNAPWYVVFYRVNVFYVNAGAARFFSRTCEI